MSTFEFPVLCGSVQLNVGVFSHTHLVVSQSVSQSLLFLPLEKACLLQLSRESVARRREADGRASAGGPARQLLLLRAHAQMFLCSKERWPAADGPQRLKRQLGCQLSGCRQLECNVHAAAAVESGRHDVWHRQQQQQKACLSRFDSVGLLLLLTASFYPNAAS